MQPVVDPSAVEEAMRMSDSRQAEVNHRITSINQQLMSQGYPLDVQLGVTTDEVVALLKRQLNKKYQTSFKELTNYGGIKVYSLHIKGPKGGEGEEGTNAAPAPSKGKGKGKRGGASALSQSLHPTSVMDLLNDNIAHDDDD